MSADLLLEAIMNIQYQFARANLHPPAMLILATHDDGMKLLSAIHGGNLILQPGTQGKPVEGAPGEVFTEIQINGLKVRWPAMRYALPGGRMVWQ